MLSPQLRRKVHDLWSLFWSSGLSNPLVAIEQITYLLFIRQLESLDVERVKRGKPSIYAASAGLTGESYDKCRWSYIRQNPSFTLLNETVFPWLRSLEERVGPAQNGNAALGHISGRLRDAYFILDVNKLDTLKRAVGLIDDLFRQLDTRSVNSDIMGDLFEYLLEEVKESGKNGQFRTPRHIIRFMVQLLDPELGKTILDPACGSGGFLINSLLHWKAEYTDEDVLRLEWDGTPHDLFPAWPNGQDLDFSSVLHGYDNDRTMVRIAWMNLLLHDLDSPDVHQLDSLSKRLGPEASGSYDYILANPPFTGSVDEGDLNEDRDRFPRKGAVPMTTKSELLFVWLMLDLLKIGGRAAVIVPDGVLFGNTNAHRALRRQLLFENTLEAVVSLPANAFQPYSGVKTSILLFQKADAAVTKGDEPRTREVWFYEVNDEAFTLDQKRKARYGEDNDLWDALEKFKAWKRYRQGEAAGEADSIDPESYYQPGYWEERWRTVDDDFLNLFPEKAGDKGRTLPLHELWPDEFSFSRTDPRRTGQYDDAVLDRIRPRFEEALRVMVDSAVQHENARTSDPDKAVAAAEKAVRTMLSSLNTKIRRDGILDREHDQFGQNALKTLLKEAAANVEEWAMASLMALTTRPLRPVAPATVANRVAEVLAPLIKELAKLDGYNVWRRSRLPDRHPGKLAPSGEGEPRRVPTQLSWTACTREWAALDGWGADPKTGQPIAKPTHKDGILDPEYFVWLRDTLKVFEDDGTVKKGFLDRLDPECIEGLDFNLSAGRHKPFVFDSGQHRPPAELIAELQIIHREVQRRLEELLERVDK